MRDELFDRDYQASREALNHSIDGALKRAGTLLRDTAEVLHRIQWDAPWTATKRRKRSGIA